MKGPLPHKSYFTFDGHKISVNNLTVERSEEIEKVVMPLLTEMLDKLRQEKPHLFKSSKK